MKEGTVQFLGWMILVTVSALSVEIILPTDSDLPVCPPGITNDSIYFPNQSNCSTYYQCSNGHAILQSCPEGLVFNPMLRVCDHPFNVNCTNMGSWFLYPFSCTSAILPNPYSNTSFIYCDSNGDIAAIIDCPSGLYFNPDISVCDWDLKESNYFQLNNNFP